MCGGRVLSVISAQRRLFVSSRFEGAQIVYNIPIFFEIKGELDIEKLEEGFRELIRRHESLRTSFEIIAETPVQKIADEVDFRIIRKDWRLANGQEKTRTEIRAELKKLIQPFDTEKAPLLRVILIDITANKKILLADVHHIVSDGITLGLLFRELSGLYRGLALEEAEYQYKDYVNWQQEQEASGRTREKESFWLERFKGEIPIINLPTDNPRPGLMNSKEPYTDSG